MANKRMTVKRFISLIRILFVVMLVVLLLGCATPDTKTYVSEFGFSMDYPSDWIVVEDVYPSGLGTTLTLSTNNHPLVELTVMFWIVNDEFFFYSLDDLYYRGIIAPWEDSDGFEIISERRMQVQEIPAKEVIFRNVFIDEDLYKHIIISFLDTRFATSFADYEKCNAFKIIYRAPLSEYDLAYPVFEKVVSTFRLTECADE